MLLKVIGAIQVERPSLHSRHAHTSQSDCLYSQSLHHGGNNLLLAPPISLCRAIHHCHRTPEDAHCRCRAHKCCLLHLHPGPSFSSAFSSSRATLVLNDGLCFLRFYFMSCSFYSVYILGAEPALNNLSKIWGLPHSTTSEN